MTSRQPRILYILTALLLLGFIFVGYTSWRILTQKPGESTVTSGGLTVAKPSNSVQDATITDDGYLLLKYEDGTERRVGTILGLQGAKGEPGDAGRSPSQAEIALAVINYCSDGKCDAKSPSADQVATAVRNYCDTRNSCKGDTGAAGSAGANATTDQIMAAVTQYCSDGRCTGPTGSQGIAGAPGADGKTAVMACVIRDDGNYVAWKYETETDSAYRNLYKIPPLGNGSDCIDLRSA